MQLGIFAKTFPEIGAVPVLKAVKAAGYETAQFNLSCLGLPTMPDELDPAHVQEILQASTQTGISIAALSGTYNMAHPEQAVREVGLRRLELLMQHAHGLGTRLITLCTGTRDPHDQWKNHPDNSTPAAWQVMHHEVARAAALAEQYDVDLGIEPELSNVVSSAKHAKKLIDTLGSKRLKIILDPANLFEHGDTAHSRDLNQEAIDLLGEHIAMAHAKDRRADGTFAAPGGGVIDFVHLLGLLRSVGFDGPVVTHGLNTEQAPAVAQFLKRIMR